MTLRDDTNWNRLLDRAEESVEWPALDSGRLARDARRARLRRQRRRRISAMAGCCVLVVLAGWLTLGPMQPARRMVTTEELIAQAKRQLNEARLLTLRVEAGLVAQQADQLLEWNPVRDRAIETGEAVAAQMLHHADHRRGDSPAEAQALYRELIRLFPDTRGAANARSRLDLATQGDS